MTKSIQRQRQERFIKKSEMVITQIRDELQIPDDERISNISSSSLQDMIELLTELRNSAIEGKIPPKESRNKNLTWIIADSWPFGSELGNKIFELEEFYSRL